MYFTNGYEESEQHVLQVHVVHFIHTKVSDQVCFLVAAFVRDPHIQGRYYATPIANVHSNISDKHIPS